MFNRWISHDRRIIFVKVFLSQFCFVIMQYISHFRITIYIHFIGNLYEISSKVYENFIRKFPTPPPVQVFNILNTVQLLVIKTPPEETYRVSVVGDTYLL